MNRENQPELPPKIYAEAVVRSVSGISLLRYSSPITNENVAQFYAEPNLIELTVKRLQTAGFEILDVGKATISIAAKPEVYERSLQTKLEAVERPCIKEMGEPTTGTFINSVDSKPFGEIDISNTIWDDLLDGIALNEPVFYTRPTTPATAPPEKTAKYLNVPDEVAQGLNATLVHQKGITGKGVKVAMIDSGWYPHPFFRQHNYKVNVVLTPGSTAPEQDHSGHGTGESANIFAIAPEVELTMIKFGVGIEGEIKNVTSVAAFKQAIEQQPDIISCSWGSDQRNRQLSPQDKLLAVAVARAVSEGIVVIFAAGNGQWGFPAQHPDAIAVGGAYKHLDGSLKGLLEASNYASSFVSPVYQGRQVPDVCGLVGQLPYGAYIRLPVPPGSQADRDRSASGDGTQPSDGWAVFSGTSAAAPQIAGICALLKQIEPNLSPARVKQILQQTAIDVTEGFSHPSTGGASARAGVDLATGYGLVDAYASVEAVKAFTNEQCCDDCVSSVQNFSKLNPTPTRRNLMSEFPKLHKKLDQLLWELQKTLQKEIKNLDLEADVELNISESNFILSSPISKVAYSLRERLDICFSTKGEVDPSKLTEEHISSAQALMKLGRYQEIAIRVLTEGLLLTGDDKKEIRKLASQALSECGTEISMFDSNHRNEISSLDTTNFFSCDNTPCICRPGKLIGTKNCDGKKYLCTC